MTKMVLLGLTRILFVARSQEQTKTLLRLAILLENTAALLSKQRNCRKLFAYLVKDWLVKLFHCVEDVSFWSGGPCPWYDPDLVHHKAGQCGFAGLRPCVGDADPPVSPFFTLALTGWAAPRLFADDKVKIAFRPAGASLFSYGLTVQSAGKTSLAGDCPTFGLGW